MTATAFSFFLGSAAGLYNLYKAQHVHTTVPGGSVALFIGTAVSFVTALLAVSWLLRYVASHSFKGFALYRMVLGAVVLGLVALGVLR